MKAITIFLAFLLLCLLLLAHVPLLSRCVYCSCNFAHEDLQII